METLLGIFDSALAAFQFVFAMYSGVFDAFSSGFFAGMAALVLALLATAFVLPIPFLMLAAMLFPLLFLLYLFTPYKYKVKTLKLVDDFLY